MRRPVIDARSEIDDQLEADRQMDIPMTPEEEYEENARRQMEADIWEAIQVEEREEFESFFGWNYDEYEQASADAGPYGYIE